MKDRLEVLDFKYKVIVWTFLIFLVISFLAPITGGDWENYVIGSKGLQAIFNNVRDMYVNFEGRVVSRSLIDLFVCSKILFNVIFALLMSGFMYSCFVLMGKVKNKYYYLLPLIGILLLNVNAFSQNYTFLTGVITYTFPAIITIIYIIYLYSKEEFEFSKKEFALLSLTNLAVPLFVENIALAFISVNVLITIYRGFNNKKMSYPLLIFTIFSLISLAVLLLSPGSALRMATEEVSFNSLSLIDRITSNLSNFNLYVFARNPFLLILMLIPMNYVLFKKTSKNVYSRLILILFNLIPLFSIICNFYVLSPININMIIVNYEGIFSVDNWYFIFYWLIFLGIFIYSIFSLFAISKQRSFLVILTLSSLVSVISMLASPIWGDRVVILFVLGMLIVSCILIKEINVKLFPKLTITLLVILLLYYVSAMSYVCYFDMARNDYIKEQLANGDKTIYVKATPVNLIWEYNPSNKEQFRKFRLYYNIPDDINIEVKYYGIFSKFGNDLKK